MASEITEVPIILYGLEHGIVVILRLVNGAWLEDGSMGVKEKRQHLQETNRCEEGSG
jgi:hypothetical protein|eukprot:m.62697 g.62697  ORF g.62697 m.62697 type:complete len:57 (+) comp17712_c0_seq2:223-393(+)